MDKNYSDLVKELKLHKAFIHYLEGALVVFEERGKVESNKERIEIYYKSFKEAVMPLTEVT